MVKNGQIAKVAWAELDLQANALAAAMIDLDEFDRFGVDWFTLPPFDIHTWDNLPWLAANRKPIPRKYECGHEGPSLFWGLIYGEVWRSSRSECPDCLVARAKREFTQCGWCGGAIAPGEMVRLVDLDQTTNTKWNYHVHHPQPSEAQVGGAVTCIRSECCPLLMLADGYWTGEGVQLLPW